MFPEPFSSINGLRELSDGRLIISDRTEQVVRFIDLETGDLQDIGRAGEGPGEYRMPGNLLPLPGDSTLLSDLGRRHSPHVMPGQWHPTGGLDWRTRATITSSGRALTEAESRVNRSITDRFESQMTTKRSRGNRTMTMPRPDTEGLEWPEVKPPFPSDGLRMTPDGELWIGRYMRAGEAQSFDVFDESGRRVVGFGNGTLTVYADEDDLQWLERYAR